MCVRSFACDLCVDVGFESECCSSRLVLNVELVSIGLKCELYPSFGTGGVFV